MSAKHNTEFTCDGCGKKEVEREGKSWGPEGWTQVGFIGGSLQNRDNAHVCSKACAATYARKLADELDGVTPVERQFFGSNGGPYR